MPLLATGMRKFSFLPGAQDHISAAKKNAQGDGLKLTFQGSNRMEYSSKTERPIYQTAFNSSPLPTLNIAGLIRGLNLRRIYLVTSVMPGASR